MSPVHAQDDRTIHGLFRAHVDTVWRTAVALGIDTDAAHDVVQEVFMIAHRRLDSLDPARPARAWLLGITRNVVRHTHRGTQRRRARLQRVPPPLPPESPSAHVERSEAAALVDAFLEHLHDKKRDVFVLGYIEGLSAREIAATLGLKLPTVYARARAAEAELAAFVRRQALPRRRAR